MAGCSMSPEANIKVVCSSALKSTRRPAKRCTSSSITITSSEYYRSPIAPVLDMLPAEVVLAPTVKCNPLIPVTAGPSKHKMSESVATQTLYRESEAQTDPFSPNPIKTNQNELALLYGWSAERLYYLSSLGVVSIEADRQLYLIESALPPSTDEASLELRRDILESLELEKFEAKGKAINRRLQQRLKDLQQLLQDRTQTWEYMNEQRLDRLRQTKQVRRKQMIERIQHRRLQILRKLTRQYIESGRHRDIIEEYADAGSRVFAPRARDGQLFPKGGSATYNVKQAVCDGLNVEDLSGLLNRHAVYIQPPAPTFRSQGDGQEIAQGSTDATGQAQSIPLSSPRRCTPPSGGLFYKAAERPPTPTIGPCRHEKKSESILLLQRLLRGRAEQTRMLKGRERHLDLIGELQYTATIVARVTEQAFEIRDSTLHRIAGAAVSDVLAAEHRIEG